MTSPDTEPVVAVFADRGSAEAAIDNLWHEGFQKDQIGMATANASVTPATTATEAIEENGGKGAFWGAIEGTTLGAFAGAVVTTMIPGVGPVLGAGLLASLAIGTATGAATGAALGSFVGPFFAMGISKEQAIHYQSQLKEGHTVIVVRSPGQQERAITILRSHAPFQIYVNNAEMIS